MEQTSKIQSRKPSADFNLSRMEAIFDRANGQVDVPHRHDYYTVLLVDDAKGKHIIDYQTYKFNSKEVYFVSPGQIHQVITPSRPKGWAFTFSRDFLTQNNIPESFISNISLFNSFGEAPPLKLDKSTYAHLLRIIKEMETCFPLELNYRNRALGALLQLFLIYCNNTKDLNTQQLAEDNSGVCILRDFKNLIEEKYTKWHKVGVYASAIHISPKHLSYTVKKITGKSAKEIIQDRLSLEAKRLLLHTNLTIKEIAYHIGFEEPLHFSGFFKKQVGISPSIFRSNQ